MSRIYGGAVGHLLRARRCRVKADHATAKGDAALANGRRRLAKAYYNLAAVLNDEAEAHFALCNRTDMTKWEG